MNKINIAIDGHSSCGKSTLAKELAKSLDYVYIDSGAMYRAVALYCINNQVDLQNGDQVESALNDLSLEIQYPNGEFRIFLNGEDITRRIVHLDVSSIVSQVATLSSVRRKLVEIQQSLGANKGVVMDGRDIGTIVFPAAELKLYITANIDIRTDRRFKELENKDMAAPFEEVRKNLISRDHIDSTRADSPLKMADDAILIDNSYMDRAEQLYLALQLAQEKILKPRT